ncbi:FtsX-like permease family protein [Tabrizicola sp. BL-A-41-H6]|uniref:FtsX-like permease family protein n=1 Tax=Tabrizicola sp. BL-A-41-H6 TaxID=3421107 RepID=UPI003D67918B
MGALMSHWLRHPMQLLTLLGGLALGTALWSGVQAINAEARAAYARAVTAVGEDALERIVAVDGGPIRESDYVALRRAGWLVSPLVEGRHRGSGLRVIGIDPLTLPSQAAVSGAVTIGGGDIAGFLGGTQGLADAETIAALAGDVLPGVRLDPAGGLPQMTVVMDVGAAQRLLAAPGQLDALILAPGPHPDGLPPNLSLRAASRDGSLARLTDSFHLNLTAFGFLAFAVGLFIVHSAIGLAFEQRRPVFRTLRALGLSAGALTGLLVVELLVLAIFAGLLGVALGYLVAAALLPDVSATLSGLYGAAVPGTLSIRAEWWVTGLVIAVMGTLAAAGQSLWRLWHLPVLAPAQARAWALASSRTRRQQFAAAVALLVASAGLVGFGHGLYAAFGGLAALLLGAALALPSVMDAVVRIAQRQWSGVLWDWFWADTRQQLPGLSLALMALLLAMAANIGVGTMVTSFRTTFVGWLDQRLASELYLTVGSVDEAARLTEWLRTRTDAILPIVSVEADLIGQPGSIYGVADHATYRDHWPLLQSIDGVWDRIANGTGVLVNEQMARRGGLGLGAEVALPEGALPIVGVYSDYGNPSPQALIGLDAFQRRFPDAEVLRFGLRVAPDRAASLAADLRQTFELPEMALVDQAGIKAFSLNVFDRTFTVTAALNVLTLGVAGLAMFASLLTLSTFRQPQLAPVWAMGLTLRHIALLDLCRTLVLATLACLAALPLGLALAWVLLAVVNVEAFGWRLPMQVFPGDWLGLIGAALLAIGLAALIPTLKLARRAPVDLLRAFAHER